MFRVHHDIGRRIVSQEIPEVLAPGHEHRHGRRHRGALLRFAHVGDSFALGGEHAQSIIALVCRNYEWTGVEVHRREAGLWVGLRAWDAVIHRQSYPMLISQTNLLMAGEQGTP